VKLKKCKWFHSGRYFIGVDVCGEGNFPTKAKLAAFQAIEQPHMFANLQMLIAMFGFYSRWLPNYKKIGIKHLQWILKQQPAPGSATPAEEREVAKLWEPPDLALLEQLKEEVVINGLVLASPYYYSCQFYLKTNWSKHGIVALRQTLLSWSNSRRRWSSMA
jgi:hypothetical protein